MEEACRKGDAYLAHKTLRKLRPWEPQTRAQLQSSEGSLLTPQEELTMLETHVTKVFAKYPQLNRTVSSLPDMTSALLGKHIGSIRPHKAVPTGSAPAAAWKLCASTAGASLAAHLNSQAGHRPCPATAALEAPLKDADMCFIPKPSKPATTPGNLRPLGIIRPDGKGLAGACRDLLKPVTEAHLRDIPQFAYQPHRGLSDALGRAIQHVTDVRAACKRHRRTRRELKLGIGKTQLEGGICFALDLSQAFDMVDRADLSRRTLTQRSSTSLPLCWPVADMVSGRKGTA